MLTQDIRDRLENYRNNRRAEEIRNQFKDSYRLLCGGVVIAQTPSRFGSDFAIRGLEKFRDHLKAAITSQEAFEFVGAGGRMTAKEYLKHHESRLQMVLVDDFQIVEPGAVYPLAPNSSGIC